MTRAEYDAIIAASIREGVDEEARGRPLFDFFPEAKALLGAVEDRIARGGRRGAGAFLGATARLHEAIERAEAANASGDETALAAIMRDEVAPRVAEWIELGAASLGLESAPGRSAS